MKHTHSAWVIFLCIVCVGTGVTRADNMLVNGGFETFVNTTGSLPTDFGYWSFDPSEIVTTKDGITPIEGIGMLQFIYSGGYLAKRVSSEVLQIVDVSSFDGLIQDGEATATVAANFNRVMGDSQTDSMFGVEIKAYAGLPSTFPDQSHSGILAQASQSILTDGDIATWEEASTSFSIPIGTDFLAVRIWASENIFDDAVAPEFDGHYADAVTLEVVPEPATMCLLVLGGVALLKRRIK
jgi:hypothetical protein